MRNIQSFQPYLGAVRGFGLAVVILGIFFHIALEDSKRQKKQLQTGKAITKTAHEQPLQTLPVAQKLPDFAAIKDVKLKKKRFFGFLLAHIQAENIRIAFMRDRIKQHQAELKKTKKLKPEDTAWLSALGKFYELPTNPGPDDTKFYPALLRHVDILPPSMVLAQGANESGWGGSRFARQGNNLFGVWCYTKGCGMVPKRRDKGLKHEVKRFSSATESVRDFYHNINTHPAYAPLRDLRANLRKSGRPLTGNSLAAMLTPYSQRGGDYVKTIQHIIDKNRLQRFDKLLLNIDG